MKSSYFAKKNCKKYKQSKAIIAI